MSGRLQGQTAWISGGASGIGEAVARLFASEGAGVAIIDVNQQRGRQVEASLGGPGKGLFLECDVSSEHQVQASIDRTAAHFGGLQILVNAAGIVDIKRLHESTDRRVGPADGGERAEHLPRGQAWAWPPAAQSAQLRGEHRLDQQLRGAGGNSRLHGVQGRGAGPESIDRPGLRGRRVAVQLCLPGHHRHAHAPPSSETRVPTPAERSPAAFAGCRSGGSLNPEDIARAVLYFSCEDSAGVTGTSLVIDGGYLAAAEWESATVTLPDDLS